MNQFYVSKSRNGFQVEGETDCVSCHMHLIKKWSFCSFELFGYLNGCGDVMSEILSVVEFFSI